MEYTLKQTEQEIVEDLQIIMKKLNIWISPNDLKVLIKVMDPFNTGLPQTSVLVQLFEKQKATIIEVL